MSAVATKPAATQTGLKMIVDREAMGKALSILKGVVATRSPRPQLLCVHIETALRDLILSATDGEMGMRVRLTQVDIQAQGECLAPLDRLAAVVGVGTSPTITIAADGPDGISVVGDAERFTLYGYPHADFPPLAEFDSVRDRTECKSKFTCSLVEFVRGLGLVAFAVDVNTSRYAVAGVLLRTMPKQMVMASTDGRRMAIWTKKTKGDAAPAMAILPNKAVALIRKLADHEACEPDADTQIEVCVTAGQVLLRTASGAVIQTTLIESTFPPYDEVIPTNNSILVTANREALASAIRAAMVMTSEESRGVKFAHTAADKMVRLSGVAPERGASEVECKVESHEGKDLTIGQNPQYFMQALDAMDCEVVTMRMEAPNKPVLITMDEFQYVQMPIKPSLTGKSNADRNRDSD